MKKNLIRLLLILLLTPFAVYAATCDQKDISITKIEVLDSEGNAVEKEDASFEGNKVNLNLRFDEVGDFIEYEVVVKNNSKDEYILTKRSFDQLSNYIDYSLETGNKEVVISPGEEKSIILKASYANEVDPADYHDGTYNESQKFQLNIKNDDPEINNPYTKSQWIITLFLLLLVTGVLVFTKKEKVAAVIILSIMILPFIGKAACQFEIEIDSEVEISQMGTVEIDISTCYLLPGIHGEAPFRKGMTVEEWTESPLLQELLDKAYNEYEGAHGGPPYGDFYGTARNIIRSAINNLGYADDYVIQQGDSFHYNVGEC